MTEKKGRLEGKVAIVTGAGALGWSGRYRSDHVHLVRAGRGQGAAG